MDAGLKNIKAGKRENITMGLGPGRFGPSSWEEVKVWLHIHIFGENDKENVICFFNTNQILGGVGGDTNINSCPFLIAYNDDFMD